MDYGQYQKLEFRRKFFRFIGASVDIINPDDGSIVGYIEMKGWKLKEDIRIYSDKTMDKQLMQIHARSVIDFGATYDVSDATTGERLFSTRRKGLRSMFVRDKWELLDTSEQVFGYLEETSSSLALVRRYTDIVPFVGPIIDLAMSLWPITYSVSDTNNRVSATLTHQRNPLIVKFSLDRTDAEVQLDPRIAVAATALLSVIDASKN